MPASTVLSLIHMESDRNRAREEKQNCPCPLMSSELAHASHGWDRQAWPFWGLAGRWGRLHPTRRLAEHTDQLVDLRAPHYTVRNVTHNVTDCSPSSRNVHSHPVAGGGEEGLQGFLGRRTLSQLCWGWFKNKKEPVNGSFWVEASHCPVTCSEMGAQIVEKELENGSGRWPFPSFQHWPESPFIPHSFLLYIRLLSNEHQRT